MPPTAFDEYPETGWLSDLIYKRKRWVLFFELSNVISTFLSSIAALGVRKGLLSGVLSTP